MYVCICKAISEKDLLETVKSCGRSLREVQNSCGAATHCGACLKKIEKYLSNQAELLDPSESTIEFKK